MRSALSIAVLFICEIADGFQLLHAGLARGLIIQKQSMKSVSWTALFLSTSSGPQRASVKEDLPTMNERISAPEVRVVASVSGAKDQALGIMTREQALAKAKELGGLDLIMINDKSDPPVCRIVDYSKFRYMQEKKAKEIKKNSKVTEVKEVKMSYNIDVHDYDVRRKNAARFIKQGNRVKCTVVFRGREVTHDKLGFELLEKLASDLEDISLREGRPKREGRSLSLILGPRAEVLKSVNEIRKIQDKAKKEKKTPAAEDRQTNSTGEASASTVAANGESGQGPRENIRRNDA